MVFQTQVPISLVILVIGIQDLYISKYKYTIMQDNSIIHNLSMSMTSASMYNLNFRLLTSSSIMYIKM